MQPEALFPISLNLKGRHCLVLGGGPVALAKTKPLLGTGATITLVAEHLIPELGQLVKNGKAKHTGSRLTEAHCQKLTLAIDSKEQPSCSKLLASMAHQHNFLLNSVDQPANCDYFTPAVVRRGPLQIAISTGGAAPTLARNIRQTLERLLPQNLDRLIQRAGLFRDTVKSSLDADRQKQFWNRLFEPETMKSLPTTNDKDLDQALQKLLGDTKDSRPIRGSVSLVGAGAGSADMITLKGLRALETADIILHDALLDPALLEHARRDAHIMPVGKRCGKHSSSQAFINRSLANFAKQGKKVVRLKCGDPFIFGRGGEELLHLLHEGIETDVIPGVTAAAVAAAETGLPLTHRGIARRITFMTAATNSTLPEDRPDWPALLNGGTVALYMARRSLARTLIDIESQGLSCQLPVMVISNAGTSESKVTQGTLSTLSAKVASLSENAPTLVIIGETGNLAVKAAPTPNKLMAAE